MSNFKIVVYSKNHCAKCMMTKNLFKRSNIEVIEINVDQPEHATHLDELIAAGHKAMPVVRVYDNQTNEVVDEWVDFNDKKIKEYSGVK